MYTRVHQVYLTGYSNRYHTKSATSIVNACYDRGIPFFGEMFSE